MAKAKRARPKSTKVVRRTTARRSARKPVRRAVRSGKPLHGVQFPNESVKYRAKRNELLRAEMDLRTRVERVAALRRKLPLGGEVRAAHRELPMRVVCQKLHASRGTCLERD